MITWAELNTKLTDCFDGVRDDMRSLFARCAEQQKKIDEQEKQIANLRDIIEYYREKECL